MTISNISETTGPVVTKLYVEFPVAEGTKICPKGAGHMANMVAILIESKNL